MSNGVNQTETISHSKGNTFRLTNPAGGFVCDGPLWFMVHLCGANGWKHRLS